MPVLLIALAVAFLIGSGKVQMWSGADPIAKPVPSVPPKVPPSVKSDTETYAEAVNSIANAVSAGVNLYNTISTSTK